MKTIDFSVLNDVFEQAGRKAVSVSLHFCEGEGGFYFSVTSPADSECFIGKVLPFEFALIQVVEWIESI